MPHRALEIDEIVRAIFINLPYRRDHYSLAMCCRMFHGPALDKLWREVEGALGFSNLINLFPPEFLEVSEDESGNYVVSKSLLCMIAL